MTAKHHDQPKEHGPDVPAPDAPASYGPDGRAQGAARTQAPDEAPASGTPEAPAGELALTEAELTELCRARVCPGCSVMQEAQADKLRALADTDNLRKRLERETAEIRKYAGEAVLADLLPVLDNLDLALTHGRGVAACKDFIVGVDMTRRVFLDTLRAHGLDTVGQAGEEFNPQFHEAVGMAADPSQPDNTVAQVMQNGYMLKGRLLRPAKVMVNKLS